MYKAPLSDKNNAVGFTSSIFQLLLKIQIEYLRAFKAKPLSPHASVETQVPPVPAIVTTVPFVVILILND